MVFRTLRTLPAARSLRLYSVKSPKTSSDGISSSPKDGSTMPHVNEEVVAYDNILGGQKSPTEAEETVPVQDILNETPEGRKSAPKAMKDGIKLDENVQEEDATNASTSMKIKYELPGSDSVLTHLVGVLMKDGKKSQAQSRIQASLELLQRATQKDPLASLKDAIERVSPLMKMVRQ